jgi:hypothetical protein
MRRSSEYGALEEQVLLSICAGMKLHLQLTVCALHSWSSLIDLPQIFPCRRFASPSSTTQ